MIKKAIIPIGALAGAVLLWAAYPPHNETLNAIVALVPLLMIARTQTPKRAAGWLFAAGAAYWILTLSWMPAIIKNGGPWPLVGLGWFALSAYCAGFMALFGWVNAKIWETERGGRIWKIFAEAGLWAGCEWLRSTMFGGFAWNHLGTAFWNMPSFAAPARIGGVYLVSACVVLVNGVFATMFLRMFAKERVNRWVRMAETGVPLVAVLWCLTAGSRAVSQVPEEVTEMRVAVVQRSVPCRFLEGEREDPHEGFGRLMEVAGVTRPDLVVLAESAMSEFGKVRSFRAQDAARRFLEASRAKALIAGGDDVVSNRFYNSAALYVPNGEAGAGPVDVYHKQHLVPFGEFIPLDKWITPLQKLSPVGVSLHPGEGKVFELETSGGKKVKVAPLICYEDTDGRLAAEAKAAGADVIVLITNDNWFSQSAEAEAHAAQAVMRAIETGLPIVRAGNGGVSCVIHPDGRMVALRDGEGRLLRERPGVFTENLKIPLSHLQ